MSGRTYHGELCLSRRSLALTLKMCRWSRYVISMTRPRSYHRYIEVKRPWHVRGASWSCDRLDTAGKDPRETSLDWRDTWYSNGMEQEPSGNSGRMAARSSMSVTSRTQSVSSTSRPAVTGIACRWAVAIPHTAPPSTHDSLAMEAKRQRRR